MTTMSHDHDVTGERPRSWLGLEVAWASLAISVIWLAVLLDAVFGPDMRFASGAGTDVTTIPSVVVIALFALIATKAIAVRGFGHTQRQD